MKKEIFKNVLVKMEALGKAKVAAIAVASCVAVGGVSAGTYYIVQNANKAEAEASSMSEEELAMYEDFKERFEKAQAAYDELILDDSQNALLVSLYDTVQTMIDSDLESGKVNEETEQQLIMLENNIVSFQETSAEKLATTEEGYKGLYATHTVAPTDEAELPNFIELDEETLKTLEPMQKEYDALKDEEKYKSAYKKLDEMQNVILDYVSDYIMNKEVANEKPEEGNPDNDTDKDNSETSGTGNASGSGNSEGGGETSTGTTPDTAPEPSGPSFDELYPELWAGQSLQSRIAHAKYPNLFTLVTQEFNGVTYYGYYAVGAHMTEPDGQAEIKCKDELLNEGYNWSDLGIRFRDMTIYNEIGGELDVVFNGVPIS